MIIKIWHIIALPLVWIYKILRKTVLKPISFIFINIRKNMTRFGKNIVNLSLKCKKTNKLAKSVDEKKDFDI